jgi:hypothetical protein
MQRKTKIALAAGLAGLIVAGGAAGVAFADRGGSHRGHGFMMMQNMLERYDANKDGSISKEEVEQNRATWHADFDADKNGTLSLQEFEALWIKARNEEMVREFQRFDRDGNGQVTLEEYRDPVLRMVERADHDGDGMMGPGDRMRRRPMMPAESAPGDEGGSQ